MGKKLVLEGDLEYGVVSWEDGFEKIGGKKLLDVISEFLGPADESVSTWDEDGCHRTTYKNIRITIERLDDD